jgi:zinc protease
MGLRVMPAFVFGKDHPYGAPLTGSGTEKSVAAITRDQLTAFHATWFKPNNATLIVVGDTTLAEVTPKLEKLFAGWKPGPVPKRELPAATPAEKPVVYLMDKPGALQSVIIAGHLAPAKTDKDEIAIDTFNSILGGAFMSRLNLNLREDKHWSYGAGTGLPSTRSQRLFFAYAPVQTDKTKESVVEIQKELTQVLKEKPATKEELEMAQDRESLALPGSRETIHALSSSIVDIVHHGLPDDYYQTLPSKLRKLTTADMATAGEKLVRPNSLVWVVVGDRAKIESGIKDLGLGEIRVIDADGGVVQ